MPRSINRTCTDDLAKRGNVAPPFPPSDFTSFTTLVHKIFIPPFLPDGAQACARLRLLNCFVYLYFCRLISCCYFEHHPPGLTRATHMPFLMSAPPPPSWPRDQESDSTCQGHAEGILMRHDSEYNGVEIIYADFKIQLRHAST